MARLRPHSIGFARSSTLGVGRSQPRHHVRNRSYLPYRHRCTPCRHDLVRAGSRREIVSAKSRGPMRNCGRPLYAPGAEAGPSLVQGHLVCEPCARKERRRLIRSLIAAVGITGSTVLGLAAVAVWSPSQLGSHPWTPVLATVFAYPPLFAGALVWMKRANRRTAQRLGLQAQPSLIATNDPRVPGGSSTWTIRRARTPNER
jgi:hypothetical protein